MAVCRVSQGVAHAKKQEFRDALKYYNMALQVDPDNIDARVARGACYANMNKLEDAVHEFERALRIDPNNANARKYLQKVKDKVWGGTSLAVKIWLLTKKHFSQMQSQAPFSPSAARASAPLPTTQPTAAGPPAQQKYSIFVSAAPSPGNLAPDKLKQLLKEDEGRRRDKKRKRDKKSKRKSKHKSKRHSRSPRRRSRSRSRSSSRSRSPSRSRSRHSKRTKTSSPSESRSEAVDDLNSSSSSRVV